MPKDGMGSHIEQPNSAEKGVEKVDIVAENDETLPEIIISPENGNNNDALNCYEETLICDVHSSPESKHEEDEQVTQFVSDSHSETNELQVEISIMKGGEVEEKDGEKEKLKGEVKEEEDGRFEGSEGTDEVKLLHQVRVFQTTFFKRSM